MNSAVLSLGRNVGNRLKYIRYALALMSTDHCHFLRRSSVYETEAWGNTEQAPFYNAVLEIETELSARELMNKILEIEKILGRIRTEKWAPRTIDIDILFFNKEIINEEHLTIPHPYLQERKFVLIPLDEIMPDFIHPVLNKTISELLAELKDSSPVITVAI